MGCHLLKVTEVITEDAFRQFATLSPSSATLPGQRFRLRRTSPLSSTSAQTDLHIARQDALVILRCSLASQSIMHVGLLRTLPPWSIAPGNYNELLWVRRCWADSERFADRRAVDTCLSPKDQEIFLAATSRFLSFGLGLAPSPVGHPGHHVAELDH